MKKLGLQTPVLLFLTLSFLLTPTAFAQQIKSDNTAKQTLTKRLWEIARAKNSAQPFIILTPADLEPLSATEKSSFEMFRDPCQMSAPIIFGQMINGSLANTDCRLSDGSYADFYTFNGTQGQIVDVRLN